jgi:hypothetical protein
MEFTKNETKHDSSLLGSFDFKLLGIDLENMKEIQLSKEITDVIRTFPVILPVIPFVIHSIRSNS